MQAKEPAERKVKLVEQAIFAIFLLTAVFGSTILLREQFSWPEQDLSVAGLLALKDFLVAATIQSVFEIRVKQQEHPIRYGVAVGAMISIVTFLYWAFFSN